MRPPLPIAIRPLQNPTKPPRVSARSGTLEHYCVIKHLARNITEHYGTLRTLLRYQALSPPSTTHTQPYTTIPVVHYLYTTIHNHTQSYTTIDNYRHSENLTFPYSYDTLVIVALLRVARGVNPSRCNVP